MRINQKMPIDYTVMLAQLRAWCVERRNASTTTVEEARVYQKVAEKIAAITS